MEETELITLRNKYKQIREQLIFEDIIPDETIKKLKEIILAYPAQYSASILYDLTIGNSHQTLEQLNEVLIELVPKLPQSSLENFGIYETLDKICIIDSLMPTVNLILGRIEKTEVNQQRINAVFQKEIIEAITEDDFPIDVENICTTIKNFKLSFDENEFNIVNIAYFLEYKEFDEIDEDFFSKKIYTYFKLLDAYHLLDKFKTEFTNYEAEFYEARSQNNIESIKKVLNVTLEKVELESIIDNTTKASNKIKI